MRRSRVEPTAAEHTAISLTDALASVPSPWRDDHEPVIEQSSIVVQQDDLVTSSGEETRIQMGECDKVTLILHILHQDEQ